jgi:hypothetical protein
MPGIPVLLTIVFVILQLTGVIAWSWLWVLSPLWISLILGLLFFFFVGRKIKNTFNSFDTRSKR